ncbi:MAG: ABC transporter substrate-binding protein, partial [Deltaproteobacteria bacterium]|nr:ABC transporter substrate-binding protein [Deltaproteobacteria bacterium]
ITILGTHALAFTDVASFLYALSSRTFFCLPYNHKDANPATVQFIENFKDRYHMPPDWLAVLAIDAVNLGVEALAAVGDRPDRLKDYLNRLDNPEKTFQGLAGGYYFDTDGRGIKPIFITKCTPSLLNWLP